MAIYFLNKVNDYFSYRIINYLELVTGTPGRNFRQLGFGVS
jgi:hypothetical protein